LKTYSLFAHVVRSPSVLYTVIFSQVVIICRVGA